MDRAFVLIAVALVALFALGIAASTIKIAREYERGVVFRLGRLMNLGVRAYSSSSHSESIT